MRNFEIPKRNPDIARPAYAITQYFVRSIFTLLYGLRIEGKENIPQTGAFIIVGNHQSWFDPPIYGSCCTREIFYAAKAELFTNPILGPLVKFYNSIPIRRRGVDREAMTILSELLASGFAIIVYPEGTRFKDEKLHPPKPGVGLLALQSKVPILPVYINGSAFLYKQLFRRKLKIIFGETFEIGGLIDDTKDDKTNARIISNYIMKRIAEVGKVAPPTSD